jgi:ABC-type sugar transport system ATPase subunit
MTENILLEATGISKHFPGVQALDRVELTLREGSLHALCGENGAGKSTLMNILMGIYRKDEGEIFVRGHRVDLNSPREALHMGISIIDQELNVVPEMTIAENMFLGREPEKPAPFIDRVKLNAWTAEYLSRVGLDLDPRLRIKALSLAQIQLFEIARALSHDSDIIIMDEPTSALGEREVERLFAVIETLRSRNKGIIYVSHKLDEIFQISDTITVLRDGKYVGTEPASNLDRAKLISMMVGRQLEDSIKKDSLPTQERVLAVRGFSRGDEFEDITFDLHRGEILGIFGLMGSGRSEFLNSLYGINLPASGEVEIEGKLVQIRHPADAKRLGIAYVTEDRKNSGLVLTSSVRENVTITALAKVLRRGFLSMRREKVAVQALIRSLSIKASSARQLAKNLSGGNQQKVVLAKWLFAEPKILILDEPTRGIDVGAKREIYSLISSFAQSGYAIIVVSSEMPEILALSHRILVFREGRLTGEVNAADATQESLMHLAS